ncbi:response regulator [Phenylobacterium sp.]|jgi:CheY-like chemotaxis protein|uniref:response regulator n=1 Tax=Phenylobacterium sp. TaxID=1871053 RepID=UPI002E2F7295|nr:response regulator [Phenylobacterium sp.]HEX2559465.1 response regulator [Phenylobacterium sp.]
MTNLKVLYVDDEPDIREVAAFALELDPGIELKTQCCGFDALTMLSQLEWRPDVLLLDVMMPEMDGPTTLAQIRQLPGLSQTPAVFITARAQPQEQEAIKAMGAVGVITKPFDPMTLASDLRQILSGR